MPTYEGVILRIGSLWSLAGHDPRGAAARCSDDLGIVYAATGVMLVVCGTPRRFHPLESIHTPLYVEHVSFIEKIDQEIVWSSFVG